MSFDIKFTRLGFENACRIARQASRCQQAFSKPCLVNLISKDLNLVSSIYHIKTILSVGVTLAKVTASRLSFSEGHSHTSIRNDVCSLPREHSNLRRECSGANLVKMG